MGQVTIAGDTFDIMGTLAGLAKHLKGSITPGAAGLALAVPDVQAQYLVAATRYYARKSWEGTKTDSGQTTAFPRDGVVDSDGIVVPDGTTPDDMISAEYELASLLFNDPTVNVAAGTGSNIQSLQAGPVAVQYFRATIGVDAGELPMPPLIMDLVSKYLARGASSSFGSLSSGFGCGSSSFDDCAQDTLKGPLV